MKRFNTNTVEKLLTLHLTPPPGLTQRPKRLPHPTPYQWKLLRRLKEATGVPTADRGVHKEQRRKVCQSAMGKARRRSYVIKAMEEINAAKIAELWYLKDERRLKGGEKPRYRPSAPRRRRNASARDVAVWLEWKKVGKFGLSAIKEDIRCLKK